MDMKTRPPYICCLQDTHFRSRDIYTLRGWKKVFHTNGNQRVAIVISDKIDFKIKTTVKRDKKRHSIIIKESIQGDDITIVNTYTPNIGASKYIRQILTDIKGLIDRYNNSRGL